MARSMSVHAALVAGLAIAVSAFMAQGPSAARDGAPPQDRVARGKYLAAIMDCGGCHTDGALIGKPDSGLQLAGSSIGFGIPGLGVFYPPNLTSDGETGLGAWSETDIVRAVREGVRPDGRILAPVMPWGAYAALSDGDAAALAAYLKTLPPVRRRAPAIVAEGEAPRAPYLQVTIPK